jgi:hypothetical protein
MPKGQMAGMQQLSWRQISGLLPQPGIGSRPVNAISNQGKSQMLKMNANLVGAPRMDPSLDIGRL